MTGHTHTVSEQLFPLTHLCQRLDALMSSVDELRNVIGQLGTDIGELGDRIEARTADTDVDLGPEIETLRGFSAQLDSLAVDETPTEGETPVEGEEPPPDEEEPYTP